MLIIGRAPLFTTANPLNCAIQLKFIVKKRDNGPKCLEPMAARGQYRLRRRRVPESAGARGVLKSRRLEDIAGAAGVGPQAAGRNRGQL